MDVDQVSIHYVKESTRGVTPTNPAFQELRIAVPELNTAQRTIESRELTGDRQVRELVSVGQDVSGSMQLEFSYGNADDLIEAAMCSAWVNKPKLSPTAVTTSQFTVASGGTAFKNGMLVRGVGHTNSANNGLFKLAADATGTAVAVTGTVAEASPPAGAYIKCVGFEADTGDCGASVVSGKARLTITSASGAWTALGLAEGEWVRIGGSAAGNQFATAACNGWARIAKGGIAATTLDFDIYPDGFTTDAGSGKAIRLLLGDRIVNGVARHYFTVQRRFNDHSPIDYETTRGQEVATFGISMRPEDFVACSATFQGDTGEVTQSQISGATNLPATTANVLATQDVGTLLVDGVPSGRDDGNYIQTLQINIDNQMRPRRGVGYKGYVGRGLGKFRVSGQIESYFQDYTLAAKANNNLDVGIAGFMSDPAGHIFLWDLPATRLSGQISTPGTQQDAMFRGTMTARKSPVFGHTLLYQRFLETV